MDNLYQLPNDDAMVDQASNWIAKIDRGLTSDEKQVFKQWLSEHKQHLKLINDMAVMWDKMDSLDRLSDLFPETSQQPAPTKQWHVAIAASVAVALLLGALSFTGVGLFGDDQQFVRYETSVGENSTFYLPDNSKVLLNTNSVLLVRYTDQYRLLELKRGEFHVDVAHDKNRPLSVVANQQVIQAVGTAFSVQLDAQEIELIVTDGKVLVAQLEPEQAPTAQALRIPKTSLAVSKGEIALLSQPENGEVDNTVAKIDPITIKKNLSWRQGNLVFKGESLAQAMEEVSRYTSIKIVIADEELKHIKIAGRFKTGDVEGLIGALNNNFNIKTDRVNSGLIVLRKQG